MMLILLTALFAGIIGGLIAANEKIHIWTRIAIIFLIIILTTQAVRISVVEWMIEGQIGYANGQNILIRHVVEEIAVDDSCHTTMEYWEPK